MASPTVPIVFGGLIVWSIYRRIRRNIGRQRLRLRRIIPSLIIFSLMTCFIVGLYFQEARLMLGFGGGLVLGMVAGFFGLKLTRFETTDEGHFYIPNTRIGVALTLLLTGRLLYHYVMNHEDFDMTRHAPPPTNSPLTFFLIGLTFGYYIVYYTGLFFHTRDKK